MYGAQQPDGFLYIPGAIQAAGAGHDAMNWLIGGDPVVGSGDKVDLKIETAAIDNALTHQWEISNDTLYVNTPEDTNNPYPQYEFNHWIFKGLPSQNSGFGNHNVNLYVQGTKTQTAKIQTFYSGGASNYPGSATDYNVNNYYIPNWFNYYELAYPNSTVYNPTMTMPGGMSYPDAVGMAYIDGYDYNGGEVITDGFTMMCAKVMTSKTVQTIPVFEVSPSTNFLDVAGVLNIKGIYSYLYVDGHEETHVAEYRSGDVIPRNTDNTLPPGIVDSDGDFIPDNIESKYHLNPNDSDTTGYFTDASNFPEGSYDDRGDEEAIAAIGGLHAVVSNSLAWQQDWSDLGVQYGPRPANFPYEFVPENTNLPHTNSVPSNAVTSLP